MIISAILSPWGRGAAPTARRRGGWGLPSERSEPTRDRRSPKLAQLPYAEVRGCGVGGRG